MIRRERGIIFVVSAPSGTGKTTLCKRLIEEDEEIVFSVSYTTRAPREGEIDGKDYFFVSEKEFRRMIEKGEFAEYAVVYGNYYGTSKRFLEERVERGIDVLLDIDTQGAEKIFSIYPDAVGIFIFPPSIDELRKRLVQRGTDPDEVIERRIKEAKKEIEKAYMYHYWIVNDDLNKAFEKLKSIVTAERCRSGRSKIVGQ